MNLDIDHLARLARLQLTTEEKEKFSAQLGDVLGYIEQLKDVDVEGIDPTANASALFNVLQADEPGPVLEASEALRNAPMQRDQMFLVPRVVE